MAAAKKKKASKKALSQSQKWLAKARKSLSNCARNYVAYKEDGETVVFGPGTFYQCVNWANGQNPSWKTEGAFIISQDFRDADQKADDSEVRCEDCDPFNFGHACVCRLKTIPKAWR